MTFTRESMLALQRHFLGALSAPVRTWLEPLPVPPLAFASSAIRRSGGRSVLDLGTVSSPGTERALVRVCNRTSGDLNVALVDVPAWLHARWLGTRHDAMSIAGRHVATLEVVLTHDAERAFDGTLRLRADDRVEELPIRMTARRSHPIARFDFDGSPVPRPFDFGYGDRPYELSIENGTSIPLAVSFADLPSWLTFEVDGRGRNGPIGGPFFERTAPFRVRLRPRLLGRHEGALHVQTNDLRPELRNIELRFVACVTPAKPCVDVVPPRRVRMRADQTLATSAQLANRARVPARLTLHECGDGIHVRELPVIPAAREGEAATVTLPMRIAPARLSPGTHTLACSLRVEGGDPAFVQVPVTIDVLPRRRHAFRAETVAAIFALLVITLLLVLARGFL